MKLYSGIGPSARTVRMFLAEKQLEVETVEVNLMRGEHLSDDFPANNPGGQLPVLQLDDGFILGESLAICDYLEELKPAPALLGITAKERAETRMWCRRIDLRIMEPAIQGFKASEGYEFFKNRYYLVRSGAEELKTLSRKNLQWLEQQMKDQQFICGDRFSLADIQLFCFLEHNRGKGSAAPEDCPVLNAWFKRISERSSVVVSAHPAERK
jgi:glutathione S-transferase